MENTMLYTKVKNAYHDVIDDVTGEKVLKKDGTVKRTMFTPKSADFSSRAAYQCFNGELAFAAEKFADIGKASARREMLMHINKAISILCDEMGMDPFVWDDDDIKVIASAAASVKTNAYDNTTGVITNSEAGLKRLIIEDAYHVVNREARPRRTVIKNQRIAEKAEKAEKRRKAEAKAAAKAEAEDKARAEAIEAGKMDPAA